MKKDLNINLKDIDFKGLKDSPVFFAVVTGLFIVAILACCVYFIMNILSLKAEMVTIKKQYAENCAQVIALQEVQAKYSQLVKEQAVIDRMLPNVGDSEEYSYTMMQEMYDTAGKYHLTVESLDKPVVTQSYTTEITATVTVTGTYSNITAFADYYSGLEAMHRVEKIDVTDSDTEGLKQAVITIVALTK